MSRWILKEGELFRWTRCSREVRLREEFLEKASMKPHGLLGGRQVIQGSWDGCWGITQVRLERHAITSREPICPLHSLFFPCCSPYPNQNISVLGLRPSNVLAKQPPDHLALYSLQNAFNTSFDLYSFPTEENKHNIICYVHGETEIQIRVLVVVIITDLPEVGGCIKVSLGLGSRPSAGWSSFSLVHDPHFSLLFASRVIFLQ